MTHADWVQYWATLGFSTNLLFLILAGCYWFWAYVMIPENWIEPWSRMD